MSDNYALIQGDCLDVMKDIPNKSIDMILADPSYGSTAFKWDVVIPFDKLWALPTVFDDEKKAINNIVDYVQAKLEQHRIK